MTIIKEGTTVILHYTGKFNDGKVFGSSHQQEPLEFEVGTGQIMPAFESNIIGMKEGETRTFTLAPEDAYGEYDEDRLKKVEKERFAEPEAVEEGMVFQIPLDGGRSMQATVAEVGPEDVVLDLNHPLAGKELTFEVECLEVKEE